MALGPILVTLLDQLRIRTRPQHDRLEHSLDLLGKPLEQPRYRAVLACFLGFLAPWEARLIEVLDREGHPELYAGRRKIGLLEADLADLGLSPSEVASLPRCQDLPRINGLAAALGSLYVIEGSTLGGQVISRHAKCISGQPQSFRYFQSYGAEVGKMWKTFCNDLLAHSSPATDPAIVAAAEETFEALGRWVEDQLR
jgi:heme oxygenase